MQGGAESAAEVTGAIRSLSTESERIADTITGIAAQTNLLALNAGRRNARASARASPPDAAGGQDSELTRKATALRANRQCRHGRRLASRANQPSRAATH
jgi:hypothetical protein